MYAAKKRPKRVHVATIPAREAPAAIPSSKGFLVAYSAINPLVPVIDGLRSTVLEGVPPNWASLGAGAASSLVYLCGGFMLFKRLEVGMADIA